MEKINKSGRPNKKAKATERVVFLLTSEELAAFQVYCTNIGMSQSGAIRYMLKQANAI